MDAALRQVTAMIRSCLMMLFMVAFIPVFSGCLGSRKVPQAVQQERIADLNERALDSFEKGMDLDAAKLLQEALRLASSLDDRDGRTITLLNQSRIARHKGEKPEADRLVEQALGNALGTALYADVAQEKSIQQIEAGELDVALKWAKISNDSESGELSGRRMNLLARILLLKGDYNEASRMAEMALSANKSKDIYLEQANSLRTLGLIKGRAGQFDKALEMLQEALQIDRQQAASLKIAADLEALAEVSGLRNDLEAKKDYLKRALTVKEALKGKTVKK